TPLHTPVFLLNSRLTRFSAAGFCLECTPSHTTGTPSPEVTGSFCRVPSPQITRAPESTRLAYLCRIAVRSRPALPHGAFLGSRLMHPFTGACAPFGIGSRLSGCFNPRKRLPPCIGTTTRRRMTRSCVPPWGQTVRLRYGNVDPFPIGYAFRPHLRDR